MRQVFALAALLTLSLLSAACQGTGNDAATTAKIKTQIAQAGVMNATSVNVDTANGVVTLSGTVDSPEAKTRAVSIARATEGVTRVVDQIEVKTQGEGGNRPNTSNDGRSIEGQARDAASSLAKSAQDLAVEGQIKARLLAATDVSGNDINVDVNNGVVTLTAEAGKSPNMTKAREIAHKVDGVKSVFIK